MNEKPQKRGDSQFFNVITRLQRWFFSVIHFLKKEFRRRLPWWRHGKIISFTQIQNTLNPPEPKSLLSILPETTLGEHPEEGTGESKRSMQTSLTAYSQSLQQQKALPELLETLKMLDVPAPFTEIEKTFDVSIVIQHLNEMSAVKVVAFLDRDLICERSQMSYESGYKARMAIAVVAANHFLDGRGIASESEMCGVIEVGIGVYSSYKVSFEQTLEDLFVGVNKERQLQKSSPLEVVIPVHTEGMDEGHLALMKETPFDIPFVGNVSDGFSPLLKLLDETAISRRQQLCGIITCQGEAVVVFFNKPGVPYLFDAQGRTQNNESRGAALLKFDDVESLEKYLRKTLFRGVAPHFTMIMVGVRARGTSQG